MKKGVYLKLPTKMMSAELVAKVQKFEEMGIEKNFEDEMDDSFIYVLLSGDSVIHSFNEGDNGMTTMAIGGERWAQDIKFTDFLAKVQLAGYEIV